jgi:hypothetical protein
MKATTTATVVWTNQGMNNCLEKTGEGEFRRKKSSNVAMERLVVPFFLKSLG